MWQEVPSVGSAEGALETVHAQAYAHGYYLETSTQLSANRYAPLCPKLSQPKKIKYFVLFFTQSMSFSQRKWYEDYYRIKSILS